MTVCTNCGDASCELGDCPDCGNGGFTGPNDYGGVCSNCGGQSTSAGGMPLCVGGVRRERNTMKPIALFDLDGTCADYDGALQRDLKAIAGPNDPPVPAVLFDRAEPYLEARRQLITRQPGWFRNLAPLPLGMEIYGLAKHLGFECHILTKGPRTNRAAFAEKAEWCDEHVPDAPVHVVSDKSITYGRVLVDDWPPYISSWLAWRPRGLVLMPAHPHNEGFEHPNLVRVAPGAQLAAIEAVLTRARDRKDGQP